MIYLLSGPTIEKNLSRKMNSDFFRIFNFMGATKKSEKLHEVTCN